MGKLYSSLIFMVFVMTTASVQARRNEPPNIKKLKDKLKNKIKKIKRKSVYSNSSSTSTKSSKGSDLFKMSTSGKKTNYARLDKVRLPVNPVSYSCSNPNLKVKRYERSRNVGNLLSAAKKYLYKKSYRYNRYSGADRCNTGLYKLMKAKCLQPSNRKISKMLKKAQKICLRRYKRYWIQKLYKAKNKSLPDWARSPDTAQNSVKSTLRWARTYVKRPRKWYSTMINLLEVLKKMPNNSEAKEAFAYMYSNYYGVSKAVAARHLAKGMLGGKFSRFSQSKLYKKAIDELLGKHHAIAGNSPRLGLRYLDINYLVTQVYLPEVKANQDKFKFEKCSINLYKRRQDFSKKATSQALGKSRYCPAGTLNVKLKDIMNYPRLRLKFIEILAQKTDNPQQIIKDAAKTIARQVGAKKEKVCWLYENPYPEKIQPTAGPKAHCSAVGYKMHNMRPGFYNYVYTEKQIKKLTKLEIFTAMELLDKAGEQGKKLKKKLKRRYRRAKSYECLAWAVTIARKYHGRGRYGKMYRYSNGGPKKVSCRKFRKNRSLRKVFKNWNNYFDTVYGGKWKSHWRIIKNRWRKKLRKQRPAIIYVKRKI
ncbi:MAG: hypothetical protein PF689_09025 [Deltaproteobacteria bacterium]|nr:hypothetical protein [Deltaproteobacteria bacterium]